MRMLQVDHALVEHRAPRIEDFLLAGQPAVPRRDAARAVAKGAGQRSARLEQFAFAGIEHEGRRAAVHLRVVGHRVRTEAAPFAIALVVAHEGEARTVRVDDAHAVMVGGGRPAIGHRCRRPAEGPVAESGRQLQQRQTGGRVLDRRQWPESGDTTARESGPREQPPERRQSDRGGAGGRSGKREEAAAVERRMPEAHGRTAIEVASTCHSRPGAVAWPSSRV